MRVLAIAIALFSSTASAQMPDEFFAAAGVFFESYVQDGGVDYALIKSDRGRLNMMVDQVESFSLAGKTANEKKAFWINAYNILVIKGIVNNYPVKSPMDIGGFFDTKKHKAAGIMITLNDIENKKIRPVYNDARIHFALVCAAKGCPPIYSKAYKPSTLDAQLESRTKKAMNSKYFVRVKPDEKKVLISEIFKWYNVDFPKDLVGYINKYRTTKIPAGYKVGYYTYDWTLNQKKK